MAAQKIEMKNKEAGFMRSSLPLPTMMRAAILTQDFTHGEAAPLPTYMPPAVRVRLPGWPRCRVIEASTCCTSDSRKGLARTSKPPRFNTSDHRYASASRDVTISLGG